MNEKKTQNNGFLRLSFICEIHVLNFLHKVIHVCGRGVHTMNVAAIPGGAVAQKFGNH